jgi:hypothetical protein
MSTRPLGVFPVGEPHAWMRSSHAAKNKLYTSADEALHGLLAGGYTRAVGGFGLCGIPETLIVALRDSGAKGSTVISNNADVDGFGLGLLLETRQIRASCKIPAKLSGCWSEPAVIGDFGGC